MLRITITGKTLTEIAVQTQKLAAEFYPALPKYKEADSTETESRSTAVEIEESAPAPKRRGRPAGSKNGVKADSAQEQVNEVVEEIEKEATITKADITAALREVTKKFEFPVAKSILSKYSVNLKIDEVPASKYPQFINDCKQASA